MASPRIRWGSIDVVVSTPPKFCEDLDRFKDDGIFPACVVMDEVDALFQGPFRTYLYDIFAVMRPRLKIRQADEPRQRLPDMVPTQFIFAGATMIHRGAFSVGSMMIERFCTADVVQTPCFHRLPSSITQDNLRWAEVSDDWDRRVEQLIGVLREAQCDRTVVFVNTVKNCHVLLQFLKEKGWPVGSFMKGPLGRMGPRFRDAQKFASGETNILLATDFGGRGIDWPEVDHVINFQMPTSAILWLHRIGRTGRIGRQGLVTNFVGGKDSKLAQLIQERLLSKKDLHGVFSRRRSLRRNLRAAENASREEDISQNYRSDEGTYRLEGGLELYEEGLQQSAEGAEEAPGTRQADSDSDEEDDQEGSSANDGTLIGVLDMTDPAEAARQHRQSRGRPARGAAAAADDTALADFRRQLLESDSEDDSEQSDDGSSEEGGNEEGMPGAKQGFNWGMVGEESQDAVVATAPKRQLLNRRSDPLDNDAERRQSRRSTGHVGARKGQGVNAVSRARSGRNYSEPDDDLLPL